jgi:hypothetical protein
LHEVVKYQRQSVKQIVVAMACVFIKVLELLVGVKMVGLASCATHQDVTRIAMVEDCA